MLTVQEVAAKVARLKQQYAARDGRMGDVLAVRQGETDTVAPGMFPADWPKPIIANFIDVAARDLAEVIAPLPSFNCSTSVAVSDTARKFADKRTKIAHYYVLHSDLQRQMLNGADQYLTYGFLPFIVEPDFEAMCPRIRVDDPVGGYPEFDKWGRTTAYAKKLIKPASQLAAEYPEHAQLILPSNATGNATEDAVLEIIIYWDAQQTLMYLPSRSNVVLARAEHNLGRCPVQCARRPGLDSQMRGQFDDVIWIQLARAKMAMLGMEAAEKSVRAPLAVPNDVRELTFGGDSIVRSATPEKIRRVGLELPQGAFVEGQALAQEMRDGARYAEARQGNVDASVITGRGVQQLMGGFDTQIKTGQLILGDTLRQVLELCFYMDEKFWPDQRKNIRGNAAGTPFEISYVPSKDIKGDHTIDVTYGFAAGMDPNRALVFMLQLRGDKDIPRDLLMRQLPFDVDVTAMQQQIDIEETRDALKQALFGYAQALPVLAQQGADPSEILSRIGAIIAGIQKGEPIEAVAAKAFAPAVTPGQLDESGEPGEGGQPTDQGLDAQGRLPGVAAGQAGMGPGGRPDLESMLASLTASGQPQMTSSVMRRIPA